MAFVATTPRKGSSASKKLAMHERQKGICRLTPADLRGMKFGRLTPIERAGSDANRAALWKCRCDCGTALTVRRGGLLTGNTRSCGCLKKETTRALRRTHGAAVGKKSAEYRRWLAMKERCSNEKHVAYARYGGRGIKVCEEWVNDFEAFLRDMGPLPSDRHTIDRADVNQDYRPGNCRWATKAQQANNTSLTHWVSLNGRTESVADTARRYGVNAKSLANRLRRGVPPHEAIIFRGNGGAV